MSFDTAASLEDVLLNLTAQRDWKQILTLSDKFPLHELSKFLWAWPSEDDLIWLKKVLKDLGVQVLVSIGCGSGLLEWIIQEALGIPISGLELNKSWWMSRYSPQTYIPLHFTTSSMSTEMLQQCAGHSSYFILFCYFNNGHAFNEYVSHFDGDVIIIIGPEENSGISTDPLPLWPHFVHEDDWCLYDFINIKNSINVIAIYKRNVN